MKVLIIEDESRIAKRIERMTREFFLNTLDEINIIDSLDEGVNFIENNQLDLVLLDLNLNGDSGLDILERNVSEAFHVIIISANKHMALKAFEYGVLDFIPKPFNKERLNLALNRVLNKESIHSREVKFLGVKKRGEIELINISDVVYIKGAGVYSELILENEKTFLHDKSLEKLEQLLPMTFTRIHKSYIVKMTEIKLIKVSSGSKYIAVLKNGEMLPIGRTRYKNLKNKDIN